MLTLEPVGYVYRAELLCPNCTIEALKEESRAELYDSSDEATIRVLANRAGVDYSDQSSYDSDEFPKWVLRSDIECDDHDSEHDFDHELCGGCRTRLCD